MGSSKNSKSAPDAQEKAASASQEPETANDAPVSVSTSDNVLSASDAAVIVGGVVVIEHEQDDGEASSEGGA